MDYELLYFETRSLWRIWLKENHLKSKGIWFVFYKKHTGRKTISYNDAVEDALCYGWIDSIIKKFDDEKYLQKFTPRTNNAKWSPSNIERIKRLIKEKKITKYGLSKFPAELLNGKKAAVKSPGKPQEVPGFFEKYLTKNKTAYANFCNLAPSYRSIYIKWIFSAKKEETRLKRIEEAIILLKQNKKLGLK